MSVFGTIGNWFRGAFGGDTEEEKRRKRQQQQAAQQQAQLAPPPKQPLTVTNQPQPSLSIDKTKKLAPSPTLFQSDISAPLNTPRITPAQTLPQPTQPKPDQPHDNLAETLVKPVKPFAAGVARLFPGGQNDIKANEEMTRQLDANQQIYDHLYRQGKLSHDRYAALSKSNAADYQTAGKEAQRIGNTADISQVVGSAAQIPLAIFAPGGSLVRNMAAGAAFGAANEVSDNANPTAVGGAVQAATGAAGGAALTGIGRLFHPFVNKLFGSAEHYVSRIADAKTADEVHQLIGGLDDETAKMLAHESNPQTVQTIVKQLSVDPNVQLPDNVKKKLQDEHITAVKLDPKDPYTASYNNGVITARDQQSLDHGLYHELAHAQWQNDLTPEEKALFKGQGDASRQAVGRPGYSQEDVNSEDFANYMNEAMNGRFNDVPQEFKAVIAKYAKIALNDPQLSRNTVKEVVANQQSHLERFLEENPNLTQAQRDAATELTKKQALELTQRLEANRAATIQAIDKQLGDNVTNATDLVQQAQEAQAVQKAQNTPAPVPGVKTSPEQPVNPEMATNNDYRQAIDEILYKDAPQFQERGRLSIPQLLSPDRIIRENVTNPAEALVNKGVQAAQTSSVAPLRGVGRFFTGVSREAGITPEMQTARMQLRGGVETGKLNRENVGSLADHLDEESKTRIWATLDPEFAARMGKDVGQLTPEETVVRDKLKTIIDNTTAENLRRGLVTPEQAANESYIKRAYTVYDGNEEASKFEQGFRRELLNQYKGRKQVTDAMVEQAITDPTYLVGKKTAESEAMWAMQDYGNYLSKEGLAISEARPGYTQLPDTPVFGDAKGKFVPRNLAEDFTGFQYNNAMVSAFNDLINVYDRWGLRQAKKQILTIFNPAVQLGNQMTNRGIFANMAGMNPVQFNVVYAQVGKMIKENDQLYREAVAQGLTGIDITQADFFARRIAQSAGDSPNVFRQAVEWAQKSYSGADDKARITAYVIKRSQGYPPEEAARQVQRGFQDYKSVGFFYDMAAKTPFIGNAFVRFAADSIRIAKNAALDHPLRAAATVAAWVAFTNAMSTLSGETPEDKKARESRFGAPKLPFTDVSLAVQTRYGEVNVARFMPWYSLNEIGGDVTKFLPVGQSPVELKDGKLSINGGGWQDPVLGQVVQLAANKDFRNKPIRDPNDVNGKYSLDPLSASDQVKNIGRFLFAQNAPLGREIDATASAAQGKEDIYGKTRSLPQALLRDFGVKIEQYGHKQVKDQQAKNSYFQELDQINQELKGMTPSEQEAWKRLTGFYKLHEQVPNEFTPGTTRDMKAPVYNFSEDKWKDYAANPRLYDLMVQKKQTDLARSGTPIQPEFDARLSEGFRKQLLQNKMVAPGDDAELDQRMYSSPEWDYYMKLKKQYKYDAAKYYKDSGTNSDNFNDELVKHQDAKFPDKPDVLKQYSAAYAAYANGQSTQKPAFTDQVKAAREQYNKETFAWTNRERAARKLPAITWDVWNNPTFGFDSTPSGGGFGHGNYNPADHVNTLTSLTNFANDINGDTIRKIDAQNMPNVIALFQKLTAGGGGGRAKPRLGASSRGQ